MSSLLYCRPSDIVTAAATLSLTAGTANANFPLANLQDGIPAKPFKAIQPGAPFFFKLKAPKNRPSADYHFVVGFGYFARYVVAPVSVVLPPRMSLAEAA